MAAAKIESLQDMFCWEKRGLHAVLTYCPKGDTKIQKILLDATFRVVLTPLSRHGTIIKIICERVNCVMVSIREGLSCCDKTHGAVFLPHAVSGASFDFSSFGEKLFFCLRGYRRAIARSAVQKQPERRVRMFLCSPAAEQAANGWRRQPGLTAGGSSKPRTTANKLSPRRAKLALNVRIGRSCRAHNHHKFSHRILQPHTKRRASHAD